MPSPLPLSTVRDLFAGLAGRWSLHRTITPDGVLDGIAVFEPRPDGGLLYSERGELRLPTGRFAAERRYLFAPQEQGFTVFFDETVPRLFHDIRLTHDANGWTGSAEHPCGRDLYLTTYSFTPDGTFRIGHLVTGPAKDYRVDTLYTRAEPQEIAA